MAENESRSHKVYDTYRELKDELIKVRELLKQERQCKAEIIKELREQNIRLEDRVNELVEEYHEKSGKRGRIPLLR